MRLELNNSGAWKLVIREVKASRLNEVRASCLRLCQASEGVQLSWRLSEEQPYAAPRVLQRTIGHGHQATWIGGEQS